MATIDDYQQQLTEMRRNGFTSRQLLQFLEDNNVLTSERTLHRRFSAWAVKKNAVPLTDDQITQVKDLYRYRLLSDTEIALGR